MEEQNRFNAWYDEELSMSHSPYPLARCFIQKMKELLKGTEEEKSIVPISKMPEHYPEILGIAKPDKFVYFSDDQKNLYKVYYNEGQLCYFIDKHYIPVDSDRIFRDFFNGRSYLEDEEMLSSIGYPVPEIRKGKAKRSCFVLDLYGNLYIFPYRSNTVHHSSLTKGETIMVAGSIEVNNGKISYIDNSTGHYQSNYKFLIRLLKNIYDKTKLKDISVFFSKTFNEDSIGIIRHSGECKFLETETSKFKKEYLSLIMTSEKINLIRI